MEFHIVKVNEETQRLEELEPGDHFIEPEIYDWQQHNIEYHVRIRTDDPFWSRTPMGTEVETFPKMPVRKVEVKGGPFQRSNEDNYWGWKTWDGQHL